MYVVSEGARFGKNGVMLVPDVLRLRAKRLYLRLGTRRKMAELLNANDHTVDSLLDYGALRPDVITRIAQVLEDLGV